MDIIGKENVRKDLYWTEPRHDNDLAQHLI